MISVPPGVSSVERRPAWYRRRRRWIGIIGWELLHAALWIPSIPLLIPVILLFHLTVPLGASLERIVARRIGVVAPSGRKKGERKTPWLLARVAHVEFWRQDLPLCLGGLALTTASFFISGFFGALAVTSILAPFMASPEAPITLHLGVQEVTVTEPQNAWPLVPPNISLSIDILGKINVFVEMIRLNH